MEPEIWSRDTAGWLEISDDSKIVLTVERSVPGVGIQCFIIMRHISEAIAYINPHNL